MNLRDSFMGKPWHIFTPGSSYVIEILFNSYIYHRGPNIPPVETFMCKWHTYMSNVKENLSKPIWWQRLRIWHTQLQAFSNSHRCSSHTFISWLILCPYVLMIRLTHFLHFMGLESNLPRQLWPLGTRHHCSNGSAATAAAKACFITDNKH